MVPVKLFVNLIFHDEQERQAILQRLQEKFGSIDFQSETFAFDNTQYYQEEMGSPLWRMFLTFKKLIDPTDLIEIKERCFQLEGEFSVNGNRQVNLDPGYVSLFNVVLSSAKNYSHRTYLGKGVYVEVEFRFENKRFEPMPWTYPDYNAHVDVFHEIRKHYKQQLSDDNIQPQPNDLLRMIDQA